MSEFHPSFLCCMIPIRELSPLLDEKNSAGSRFNGGELPTTVIVDAEGNVRRRFIGARSLSVFEAMISEASRPSRQTR